jgi:hypothetical protein
MIKNSASRKILVNFIGKFTVQPTFRGYPYSTVCMILFSFIQTIKGNIINIKILYTNMYHLSFVNIVIFMHRIFDHCVMYLAENHGKDSLCFRFQCFWISWLFSWFWTCICKSGQFLHWVVLLWGVFVRFLRILLLVLGGKLFFNFTLIRFFSRLVLWRMDLGGTLHPLFYDICMTKF